MEDSAKKRARRAKALAERYRREALKDALFKQLQVKKGRCDSPSSLLDQSYTLADKMIARKNGSQKKRSPKPASVLPAASYCARPSPRPLTGQLGRVIPSPPASIASASSPQREEVQKQTQLKVPPPSRKVPTQLPARLQKQLKSLREEVTRYIYQKNRALSRTFREMDTDHNGSLDEQEFVRVFRMANVGMELPDSVFITLFRECDADGSGSLDYSEFARCLKVNDEAHYGIKLSQRAQEGEVNGRERRLAAPVLDQVVKAKLAVFAQSVTRDKWEGTPRQYAQLFKHFDVNQAGDIDEHELAHALRFKLGLRNVRPDEIRALLRHWDHDGDGVIDLPEFISSLCPQDFQRARDDARTRAAMIHTLRTSRVARKQGPTEPAGPTFTQTIASVGLHRINAILRLKVEQLARGRAGGRFSVASPHIVRKLFRAFDADGSGSLSHAEFKRALQMKMGLRNVSTADLDALCAFYDSDGDGSIDYGEFANKALGEVAGDAADRAIGRKSPLLTEVGGGGGGSSATPQQQQQQQRRLSPSPYRGRRTKQQQLLWQQRQQREEAEAERRRRALIHGMTDQGSGADGGGGGGEGRVAVPRLDWSVASPAERRDAAIIAANNIASTIAQRDSSGGGGGVAADLETALAVARDLPTVGTDSPPPSPPPPPTVAEQKQPQQPTTPPLPRAAPAVTPAAESPPSASPAVSPGQAAADAEWQQQQQRRLQQQQLQQQQQLRQVLSRIERSQQRAAQRPEASLQRQQKLWHEKLRGPIQPSPIRRQPQLPGGRLQPTRVSAAKAVKAAKRTVSLHAKAEAEARAAELATAGVPSPPLQQQQQQQQQRQVTFKVPLPPPAAAVGRAHTARGRSRRALAPATNAAVTATAGRCSALSVTGRTPRRPPPPQRPAQQQQQRQRQRGRGGRGSGSVATQLSAEQPFASIKWRAGADARFHSPSAAAAAVTTLPAVSRSQQQQSPPRRHRMVRFARTDTGQRASASRSLSPRARTAVGASRRRPPPQRLQQERERRLQQEQQQALDSMWRTTYSLPMTAQELGPEL